MKTYILISLISLLFISCKDQEQTAIRTATHRQGENPNRLVFFFPGINDSAENFASILPEITQNYSVEYDLISINATKEYYRNRTLLGRLDEDVMHDSLFEKYDETWIIANSMGTVGTILYAATHRDVKIDGIVLLGPFISRRSVQRKIERAGGLLEWENTVQDSSEWEQFIWSYLKECVVDSSMPELWLSYGTAEGLVAPGAVLLGNALPEKQLSVIEKGEHDWPTWVESLHIFFKERKLWQ